VIDPDFTSVRFAGVGNTSAFVDDGERRQALMSAPGIVGHRMPDVRVAEVALSADSILVMHSDGVRETWDLRAVPGLGRRSSPVVAASIFRAAATRRDDASVVVVRRRR
jgi:serine phosphatase RsbU (regulator of sigma subunit)